MMNAPNRPNQDRLHRIGHAPSEPCDSNRNRAARTVPRHDTACTGGARTAQYKTHRADQTKLRRGPHAPRCCAGQFDPMPIRNGGAARRARSRRDALIRSESGCGASGADSIRFDCGRGVLRRSTVRSELLGLGSGQAGPGRVGSGRVMLRRAARSNRYDSGRIAARSAGDSIRFGAWRGRFDLMR